MSSSEPTGVEEVLKRSTIRIAKKRRKTETLSGSGAREEESTPKRPSSSLGNETHPDSPIYRVEANDDEYLDDTDRDEDFELVQANDNESHESVDLDEASKPSSAVSSDLQNADNVYKLFKIILEQTDPVVWDNQEDKGAQQREVGSSQSDLENSVKLTITSQIPFNSLNTSVEAAASGAKRASRVSSVAQLGANLSVFQSDFWSNIEMSVDDGQDLIKLDLNDQVPLGRVLCF